MPLERYLETAIREDLGRKMVFVAGPRQVGKTTLARQILLNVGGGVYFNWDNREDRRGLKAARWPAAQALIVLDEIHKWRQWNSWIKGEYDKHRDHLSFLVTGSARLDIYRRGGDSLQGRYHHYRLHPLSYAELEPGADAPDVAAGGELAIPQAGTQQAIDSLLRYGGFPEPLLAQNTRTLRRWQKERLERFFREDVRDLESIRDFSSLQLLADLLPERVSALLSLNALREDLEVSHRAVTHWMDILERLYYVIRIRPYGNSKVRSLHQMAKAYLWDWSLVPQPAARFENLIALHLLKLVHYLQDREGYRTDLHYVRDRSGREVDFLVTWQGKPWFAVEAKLSETTIDPNLLYFRERMKIPWSYQVVLDGSRDFVQHGVRCLPARQFLAALM